MDRDKYKDSLFGIKGLTAKIHNRRADENVCNGTPNYCPGCMQPNMDNLLVNIKSFGHRYILSGGCKKCSQTQTRELLDYYNCKDLLKGFK